MSSVLQVCNWKDFQHYKDRDPQWVKLYRNLLTGEAWVLGTDISRLVQVASILLAARYGNEIPHQWTLIKKVAHLDCTEQQFNEAIEHLIASKFVVVQQVTTAGQSPVQVASGALAGCSTSSSVLYSEKRREEQRREEQTRASASGALADDSASREGKGAGPPAPNAYAAMSIALRNAGVNITSIHPTLVAWVDDGYTIDQVMGALAKARETKGDNEVIRAAYLDTILRAAPRPLNGSRPRPPGGEARTHAQVMAALDALPPCNEPEFPEDVHP